MGLQEIFNARKICLGPMHEHRRSIVLARIALAGVLIANSPDPQSATIIVNYAAKQTCSCIFVTKRGLVACKADLDGFVGSDLSLSVAADGVTAKLGRWLGEARYRPGWGCLLREQSSN